MNARIWGKVIIALGVIAATATVMILTHEPMSLFMLIGLFLVDAIDDTPDKKA